MFFVITGAIWMGGSGSCIVFGLYWKRGTTAAAFTTMIWSSTLAAAGFISQQLWGKHIYPWLAANDLTMKLDEILRTLSGPFEPYIVWRVKPDTFPLNSKEMYFLIITSSILLYVITSLLTCRKPFNMDRLLHRGIYNTEGLKAVEKLSCIGIV